MQSATSVAATLLAGFSFTFFVLAFAAPELAAAVLFVAGLLFLGAVQAGIAIGYYSHKPSELTEVYPEFVREGKHEQLPKEVSRRAGWNDDGWPAMWADGKWYVGWLRQYYSSSEEALKWSRRTRHLYHGDIVSLLGGLSLLVLPPAGSESLGRWVLVGLALVGVLGELLGIRSTSDTSLGALRQKLRAARGKQLPPRPPAGARDADGQSPQLICPDRCQPPTAGSPPRGGLSIGSGGGG